MLQNTYGLLILGITPEEVGHDLHTPKTNYAKLVLLKKFMHRSQFNLVKYHCSDYRICT